MDPMSKELHTYLKRLEEQQRQVLEIIAGKRRELSASRLQSSQTVARSSRELPSMMVQQNRETVSTMKRLSRDESSHVTEKSRLPGQRSEERRAVIPGGLSSSSEMRTLSHRAPSELQAVLPPVKTRGPNAGKSCSLSKHVNQTNTITQKALPALNLNVFSSNIGCKK